MRAWRRLGRQSEKRAAIEAGVLRATEELLAEGASFAELGIERIATRGGISRTAFYFYFRDKRELLVRLTEEVNAQLLAAAATWWSGEERPADARWRAIARPVPRARRAAARGRRGLDVRRGGRRSSGAGSSGASSTPRASGSTPSGGRARAPRPSQAMAFALVWMVERTFYQQLVQGDARGRATSSSTRSPRSSSAPSPRSLSRLRVWVDLTNTAHVVVLRPLVELLEARGHEVAITARPLSHTVELLEDWGHPYTVFGEHGGVRRADKARAAGSRARRDGGASAASTARSTRRWPTARRTCRSPARCCASPTRRCSTTSGRSPSTTSTAGWPTACSCPRRSRPSGCAGSARAARKLVRYPGLKEEYVLHGFEPDAGGARRARRRPRRCRSCVVRTAPSYALYLGGSETPLLPGCSTPRRRGRAVGRARRATPSRPPTCGRSACRA